MEINQKELKIVLCHCGNRILKTKMQSAPHCYLAHGSRGATRRALENTVLPNAGTNPSQGPSHLALHKFSSGV